MKKTIVLLFSVLLSICVNDTFAQEILVRLHPLNPPQKVIKEKYEPGETVYVPTIIDEPFGIPSGMTKYESGKLSTVGGFPNLNNKMVVWIDSTKCSTCHLEYLYNYNDLVDYCKESLFDYCKAKSLDQTGVVVIISPKKSELSSLKKELVKNRYSFPVYIDVNREIEKLNPMIMTNQLEADQCIMLYDGGKVYSIVYNRNKEYTEISIKLCKSQLSDAIHYKKKRRR